MANGKWEDGRHFCLTRYIVGYYLKRFSNSFILAVKFFLIKYGKTVYISLSLLWLQLNRNKKNRTVDSTCVFIPFYIFLREKWKASSKRFRILESQVKAVYHITLTFNIIQNRQNLR